MPLHDASSSGEEFELYARAIGHLEKANATSEHVKVAEMPQERDLMRDAQRIGTRIVMTVPWRENQYERIFRRDQEYKKKLLEFYCEKGHPLCLKCGNCHSCDGKSC